MHLKCTESIDSPKLNFSIAPAQLSSTECTSSPKSSLSSRSNINHIQMRPHTPHSLNPKLSWAFWKKSWNRIEVRRGLLTNRYHTHTHTRELCPQLEPRFRRKLYPDVYDPPASQSYKSELWDNIALHSRSAMATWPPRGTCRLSRVERELGRTIVNRIDSVGCSTSQWGLASSPVWKLSILQWEIGERLAFGWFGAAQLEFNL